MLMRPHFVLVLVGWTWTTAASPLSPSPVIHHSILGRDDVQFPSPVATAVPLLECRITIDLVELSGESDVSPVFGNATQVGSPSLTNSDLSTLTETATTADEVETSTCCSEASHTTATSSNLLPTTASEPEVTANKEWKLDRAEQDLFFAGRSSSGDPSTVTSWSHIDGPVPTDSPLIVGSSSTVLVAAPSSLGSANVALLPSTPTNSSGRVTNRKRGISFNDAGSIAAFGQAVSWSYNWASTVTTNIDGVQFVPMMSGRPDVDAFAAKVGGATHVLGFNEPDLGTQADMDPQTAVQLHRQGMQDLYGKVSIGSPSITNGDSDVPLMGVKWLDQFFSACGPACPVDFVTFHWYATADIEGFKQHTQSVIDLAAKHGIQRVWLTEFKPDGDQDAQVAFMKEAVAYLDATPAVERYAAFMASEGTMLTGGALNTLGSAYVGA